MTKLFALLFIASTTLTACGTDDKQDFVEAAAPLEGIYKVSAYTRNEAACAPGGSSLLGKDAYAVAVLRDFAGIDVLTLTSCASPLDCRNKVEAMQAGVSFPIEFQFTASEMDGDLLLGRGGSSGVLEGGTCVGGARVDMRLDLDGTQLTVELEETPADPHAPRDGICWTDQARESAEDNACAAMEQLTATFVEAI